MWSTTSPTANTPVDVRRRRARLRHEVAGVVVVELVDEERRVRVVPDRDEEAVGLELAHLAGARVAQAHGGHLALADDLVDHGVGDELDLLVRPRAVEHDRRGAELVAPVHDGDAASRTSRGRPPPPSPSRRRRRRRRASRRRRPRRRRRSRRRRVPGAVRSDSRPSCRAVAPVATMTVSARYSSSPTHTRKGRSEKSTFVTSSVTNSAPNRSACLRKSRIISGPRTPSA